MFHDSSDEYAGQRAAPPPPFSQAGQNNASSLPDQYPPPNPFHSAGGGSVPPLLHTSPPSSLSTATEFQQQQQNQQLHSVPQASLKRASLPYATLTPEREEALRAKGRQLLEEHRREGGSGGPTYSEAEKEAMQQRGMELLRAAREEAAANCGQHVPAPLLSAAARVAAATTAVRRRVEGDNNIHNNKYQHQHQQHKAATGDADHVSGGSRSHGCNGDEADGGSGVHPPPPLFPTTPHAAPALVHSPQQQQQEIIPTEDKLDQLSDVSGGNYAATQAHVQQLVAEVERLQRLVAVQQDELTTARSNTAAARSQSSEMFTREQLEAAKHDLIEQFNDHMSRCEQANQDYWAQVSAEHLQEVSALREECEMLTREVQALQSAQKAETASGAEVAASLQQAVTVLKRELSLAQQEVTAASLAREAAEQEVLHLTQRLREQDDQIAQLESALAAATADAQTVRVEVERIAQADNAELQTLRDHLLQLERAYSELQTANAELQVANTTLGAAQTTALTAAPDATDVTANPFADANDPLGGASHTDSVPASAPVTDDSELNAISERISELQSRIVKLEAANYKLEAANAELLAENSKLEAVLGRAPTAVPAWHAHEAVNPFSEAITEDPFSGSSSAAAAPTSFAAAPVVEDGELKAARERIVELQSVNTNLEAIISELEAANAELQAASGTHETAQVATFSAPASNKGEAANPFADADAEDPFGGSSHAAPDPINDDNAELKAQCRRIAELEAANSVLQAAIVKLEAAQAAPSALVPPAHDAANPFADEEVGSPFDGSSTTAPISAPTLKEESKAACGHITELQSMNADLKAANAELEAANAALQAEEVKSDVVLASAGPACAPGSRLRDTTNPFTEAHAEDPFGESSAAAPAPAPAVVDDAELKAALKRITELESMNAVLEATNTALQAANARLEAAQAVPTPAAYQHEATNPFAEADAEDPFSGSSFAAPAAEGSELKAALKSIAELQRRNANLEAANVKLQATQATVAAAAAAPTLSAHDATNPFADVDAEDPFDSSSGAAPVPTLVPTVTNDGSELMAARERIAQLEAESTELADAKEYIAHLEDALAEAAADLEKLQEDVEDKEHLIQALRAGEAALGSLPADLMGSGSGWGVALPAGSFNGSTATEDSVDRAPETLQSLRARVGELDRRLQEERRARQHAEDELAKEQKSAAAARTPPPSLSSQMVPGMEELGRQYADVQRRLALAEEARASLEEEVQHLKHLNNNREAASSTTGVTDVNIASQLGGHLSSPVIANATAEGHAVAVNPFAEVDEDEEEEDEVEGAVVTVRGGWSAHTMSSNNNNDGNDHRYYDDANELSKLLHPPLSDGDDVGQNTPETQASYHMSRSDTAPHGASGPTVDSVFGEPEDVESRATITGGFPRSPFAPPSRGEEEQSETQTTSAATRSDEAARRPDDECRELLDDEEETGEDIDISVSTRVAAARGRVTPVRVSKVEDSGLAMQELGRQYAEAQHRLLRSEEARQSLESEVAELRQALVQLQQTVASSGNGSFLHNGAQDDSSHQYLHHHNPRHAPNDHTCSDMDNTEDLEEGEETRTVTTSFASSVPTAARERLTLNPSGVSTAPNPTFDKGTSQPRSAELNRGTMEDDDATLGPVTTAAYSEQDEGRAEEASSVEAEVHMDGSNDEGETEGIDDVSDAAAINAALCRRVAELEDELQTMTANHEKELQALADAAADRIAALENEYAVAASTTTTTAVAADEKKDEVHEGDEGGVFADVEAPQRLSPAHREQDGAAGASSTSLPDHPSVLMVTGAPATIAGVAAARVEWEKDLEEERHTHEERLQTLKRELESLRAGTVKLETELDVFRNKDQASQAEIAELHAQLTDTRQANTITQTELQHAQEQWSSLTQTLKEMQTAHEEELAMVTAECNREIEEHDELLRQRLEEQEESYESAIRQLAQQHQEQLRLLPDAAAEERETADNTTKENKQAYDEEEVAYWKEQHSTLLERFNQLQRDYDDFTHDTAALQRRLRDQEAAHQEREQSRTTRDAAAQQLTSLHQRLGEMTQLVEAAQADAQARASELREATAHHAEVENALQAELTTLRTQAQASRDEVAKLSGLNEELSELLQKGATGVEVALRDRDAQLTAFEAQVRDLKLQLAAQGDRLTERQTLVQGLRDNHDNLQQLVEELKASNRTLETQLRECKRVSEEQARVAAHGTERAVRDAEQARVAAQHALAEQHAAHQRDIATLQGQLDDLRRELEVAQTVAATVPLEAQKHQRDLETVRERLAKALRDQQELEQQLKSSRAEAERQRRLLRGVNADGSEVNASALSGAASGGAGAEEDGVPAGASDARVNTLLRHVEELEEKLHEASMERDSYQQERDRVTMQLKSSARVAEVKEQAVRRQEAELRSMRGQLAAVRDDLAQRVQSNHALQLEMDHMHERVEDLTAANVEIQERLAAEVERRTIQEHAEAFLFAKAMSIPRGLEDYVSELCAGYHALLQVSSKDREYVYGRCDMIEKAAGEAMAEAEAQNRAYEVALADAQEEQQQLKEIIERLEEGLHKAEDAKATALAEAKAAKEELEAVQRQAREEVFNAQRDLQAAELQHADTLHSLSLLQDEVTNTAGLIRNQKATYERREGELAEELSRLQAELEERKASTRLLQQSTDENRKELRDIIDQANQARDQALREAQALRAQLERALPRLAQLEDEQAQRTADLMDTAQQLSALHKKSSSTEEVSRKHIEELNQTLQELMHAHAVLQRTHTTTEATTDRLKTQLEAVSQELERMTTKAHQQEEEVTLLRARLQELETRTNRIITDDQARLRDADRRIQGLEQRNTALQQECKSLQEAHQSLRMEFESTSDALQRRTETANAQEQQQGHQIRLLRERADTLEAERLELLTAEQAMTKERDECQREVLQLHHKMEHLQHHLADANNHNAMLNQEMLQLKTEHINEVDRLRETITDAQKELAKCRQLLAEAETHQVEQDSIHYTLTTEMNVLREELKSARAQTDKAMQQYRKEKTEREEMATLLQARMAQLFEELRGKQEQLRVFENTSANQIDTINALRQDVAELEERLKHTRKELLDAQEAATTAKEHHRRDRYELQSKLNTAEDAVAELARQQEQYRERMTTKVELYEVAELALRGEVTDLRADVARLEETLAAATQGKEAAEDVKLRQAHSIKAVESEVQALRAQTAKDMTELTALKVQLQQRTSEVDRLRREATVQLAAEKLQWETTHAAACDALEEALRAEQQATKDAREARERALASLERKQRDMAAMEEECRSMRAQVRQLQRRVDAAEYQLTALEGMAKDSAADLGVSLAELRGEGGAIQEGGLIAEDSQLDTSGVAGNSGATVTSTTAAAGASVQAVLDELVRRLNVYTFAANTLDTEDAQLTALSQALEQHQDAVDALAEASVAAAAVGADGNIIGGGVTPLRGGTGSALGLNSTPAARGGSTNTAAAPFTSTPQLPRSLTAAQQIFVQQISQASSTYVHRVEDHMRTAQQMLRSVVMALGAHEVVSGGRAGIADSNPHPRPSTVALSSRHKLQVAATIAELHRRTATLTRAVDRVVESIVNSPTTFSPPVYSGSNMSDRPSSPLSSSTGVAVNLQATLQELRRMFAEAERYALLPFNELLCACEGAVSSGSAATFANTTEQPYGPRGRQGEGLRTPPHTHQQQPHHQSSSVSGPEPYRGAVIESSTRRTPGAAAAAVGNAYAHNAVSVQLVHPPPQVPPLPLSSRTHPRDSGAAEQSQTRAESSGMVTTFSPIPADEEANWF